MFLSPSPSFSLSFSLPLLLSFSLSLSLSLPLSSPFLLSFCCSLFFCLFVFSQVMTGEDKMSTTEVGTTHYISPEIVSAAPYSFPTDVWSLGCVMHELITLRLPYYGDSMVDFVNQLMYQEMKVYERKYDVPEEIWNLVLRMLEKDPKKRVTIPEILSSRVMRKVVASVIDKHKPADQNSRMTRDDITGLKHQSEEVYKKWTAERRARGDVDAEELLTPIPSSNERKLSTPSSSRSDGVTADTPPRNSLNGGGGAAAADAETSQVFRLPLQSAYSGSGGSVQLEDLPSSNSSLPDITSADLSNLSMMEGEIALSLAAGNLESLPEFLSARKVDSSERDDAAETTPSNAGEAAVEGNSVHAASPVQQVIETVSSSLTDSVIETALFASRSKSHGRANRPSPKGAIGARPQFMAEGSNLSITSTSSFENAGVATEADRAAKIEAAKVGTAKVGTAMGTGNESGSGSEARREKMNLNLNMDVDVSEHDGIDDYEKERNDETEEEAEDEEEEEKEKEEEEEKEKEGKEKEEGIVSVTSEPTSPEAFGSVRGDLMAVSPPNQEIKAAERLKGALEFADKEV